MTTRQIQTRKMQIIAELCRMSHKGWHMVRREDWQPLEAELNWLNMLQGKSVMRFFILWPTQQIVDEEKIISMYADALATGEVNPLATGFAKEPVAMAHALSDAGIITLGSWQP